MSQAGEQRGWARAMRPFLLAGVPLMIAALLLRLLGIGTAPLHPDEIHYAHDFLAGHETAGWGVLRDLHCDMLVERRSAHPMLATLLTRWLWIAPLGPFVDLGAGFLRSFNALVGAATAGLAWAIGWLLGGSRRAWALAALVAVHPGLCWIARTLYLDTVYTLGFAVFVLGAVWMAKRSDLLPAIVAGVGAAMIITTKISAPLIFPALMLLAAIGPEGQPWQRRLMRGVVPALVAAGLSLLLVDPGSYALTIAAPSDPRYRSEWDRGGVANYLELLFVYMESYLPAVVWDAPLPLFVAASWALRGAARRRSLIEGWLLVLAASLLPLALMHHPQLSGAHGFAPLWFLVAVLASGCSGRLGLRWLIIPTLLCSLGAVGCRLAYQWPFVPWYVPIPPPDNRFAPLRDIIPARGTNRSQILLLESGPALQTWAPLIRSGHLAEGAIWLKLCNGESLSAESLAWADFAIIPSAGPHASEAPGLLASDFERYGAAEGYSFWRRVRGTARSSATADELVPISGSLLALPGRIYPYSTVFEVDGVRIDAGTLSPTGWFFHGMTDAFAEGTGLIEAPKGITGEAVISLAAPRPADVFWKY